MRESERKREREKGEKEGEGEGRERGRGRVRERGRGRRERKWKCRDDDVPRYCSVVAPTITLTYSVLNGTFNVSAYDLFPISF